MTAYKRLEVRCDVGSAGLACHDYLWEDGEQTIPDLRATAKRYGWLRRRMSDGSMADVCPECAEREEWA